MASCTPAAPSGQLPRPLAGLPSQGDRTLARPYGTTAAAMGCLERLPVDYPAQPQKRYPLVVFLHGGQETGHNLALLDGSAAVGGPQRDLSQLISPAGVVVLYPQRCALVLPAADIAAFIDHALTAYRIDPRRVYLVGHSAGAAQLISALPALAPRIAGAVALSAFDPGNELCRAKDVPLWLLHGRRDRVVPLAHTLEIARRLRACGMPESRLRVTLLDDGHDIDAPVLQQQAAGEDVLQWLRQWPHER
jgi:predicted peptidase